jgi:hypothetical protein
VGGDGVQGRVNRFLAFGTSLQHRAMRAVGCPVRQKALAVLRGGGGTTEPRHLLAADTIHHPPIAPLLAPCRAGCTAANCNKCADGSNVICAQCSLGSYLSRNGTCLEYWRVGLQQVHVAHRMHRMRNQVEPGLWHLW